MESPKEWLAKAIVKMVMIDGSVAEGELDSLRNAMAYLGIEPDMGVLVSNLKNRDKLQLAQLKTNAKNGTRMLIALARVASLDDRLAERERDFFVNAAELLGFVPEFAEHILKWANNLKKLNVQESKLYDLGAKYRAGDLKIIS